MTVALLLLLALNPSDTLGKTDAQVLAMGRDGWLRFYTARKGEGDFAMAEADHLYAGALEGRNDRALRGRASADRRRLLALRKEVGAFSGGIALADASGGTTDRLVYASHAVDSELLIGRLIRREFKGVPARTLSDVSGPLAGRRPGGTEYAPKALAEARASFGRIVRILRGSPRRESDAVLDFCRRLVLVSDAPDG